MIDDLFKIGVWSSYFLVLLIIFLIFAFLIYLESKRKDRFLTEINNMKEYKKWKVQNGLFGGKKNV